MTSLDPVAPLVGAWIEILFCRHWSVCHFVAPLVGAWIEIIITGDNSTGIIVAPLVGAWIEMFWFCFGSVLVRSLLSWERGLKYCW